ncbi:MAG: preprotein translocase subunit YajC [Treponema sp.]|nr:preprotein translocase subunit YajC [Treponema sp.]
MSFIPFLQAASASASGGLAGMFLPFLLIIVIMYFFMIRPQNKKQKEMEKMLSALKKGDKVVTIGGIHGVVSSVKENTIIVKVDDDCKIEFNRTAISSVIDPEAEAKAKAEKEAKEAAIAEKKAAKAKKSKKAEAEVSAETVADTDSTK